MQMRTTPRPENAPSGQAPPGHTRAGTRVRAAALFGVLVFAIGCEPEVGRPCVESDPSLPDQFLQPGPNVRNIGTNAKYECEQGFCATTDGTRGYCTVRCTADAECPEGFGCEVLAVFGDLACRDPDASNDCLDLSLEDESRFRYCAASSAAVITQRDQQFNR